MSVSETLYNLIILASDQPGRAKDFLAEASNIAKKFKVRRCRGPRGPLLCPASHPAVRRTCVPTGA